MVLFENHSLLVSPSLALRLVLGWAGFDEFLIKTCFKGLHVNCLSAELGLLGQFVRGRTQSFSQRRRFSRTSKGSSQLLRGIRRDQHLLQGQSSILPLSKSSLWKSFDDRFFPSVIAWWYPFFWCVLEEIVMKYIRYICICQKLIDKKANEGWQKFLWAILCQLPWE